MKKLITIFTTCISFFMLVSCEDIFQKEIVVAGKYDDSYIYHKFSQPLQIKTELDSLTNYYYGRDSIDFDLDGIFDATIVTRFQFNDSLAKINHINEDSFFRIYLKNDYHLAIKEMAYSCGHGNCNYIPLICPIDFGTELSNFQDWSDKKYTSILWFENPSSTGGNVSWWHRIDTEKMYIGIRKTKMSLENRPYYRYGWIKINAIDLKNISIASFAIEQ